MSKEFPSDVLHAISIRVLERIRDILRKLGKVVVGCSGGVDSLFLSKIAVDTLGEGALAVTVKTPFFPSYELLDLKENIKRLNLKHSFICMDMPPGFSENNSERCYICKKNMYERIIEVAKDFGGIVLDGTNLDDIKQPRPGIKALRELGIRMPLFELGIGKKEIRELAKLIGLPNWDKPSNSCLATRIPQGERITLDKLAVIDRVESYLIGKGERGIRARWSRGSIVVEGLRHKDYLKDLSRALGTTVKSA